MERNMPRRFAALSLSWAFIGLLALGGFSPLVIAANGQSAGFGASAATREISIPAAALEDAPLARTLEEGAVLERQRRWGEALLHYEQAVRTFPGRANLKERLSLARAHYDIARRYHDDTFIASLKSLSERQALDLYSEVLLKIQAHYVESPNWQELVRKGSYQLDVALSEPDFVERNMPAVTQPQVAQFRREFHRVLGGKIAYDRHEARQLVATAAKVAHDQLGLSTQTVVLEYICGAAAALDPYSSYLTTGQLDDVFSQIEGNFVGLGVEIKTEDNAILIVDVIRGGPADRAGIRAQERIIAVNGNKTSDITADAAADMLKGPEGTSVEVVVATPRDATRTLRIVRQVVDVPCVDDVKILDPTHGIGYLRLNSFQKSTSREIDAALWQLHREGMRSLIIDVRGNPGGLLTAAVEVADKFVTAGTIVSTRGRSPREDFDYKAHEVGTWQAPLVVLIDGDSASASEIFAGAIRDHRRGAIVGETSYGKGSVQGIFPLNSYKSGLRLTTAKFYSPSGQAISDRGVSPDVAVQKALQAPEMQTVAKPVAEDGNVSFGASSTVSPQPSVDEPSAEQEDAALAAALQVARRPLSQRPGK
jgi:carboxyl-terminal processing protease